MAQPPAGTLLGQNVQRLRQTHGLTVQALASRLGWSDERVLALETGNLDLDLDSVDELSLALETEPHGLFDAACEEIAHSGKRRYG